MTFCYSIDVLKGTRRRNLFLLLLSTYTPPQNTPLTDKGPADTAGPLSLLFYSSSRVHTDRTRPGGQAMNGLERAAAVLPRELRERLLLISPSQAALVQEIRLRRGQPISITGRGETRYLSANNCLARDTREAVRCQEGWVEQTLDVASRHSLYAHQDELRNGYLTTREGCRIGVCGTAVLQNDEVRSFREVTSLCLRVPRFHRGCAEELLSILYADNRAHSALICGEPACGKTSLLLDLLRGFSETHLYPSVIDERGELKETALSVGCDVLCGISKAKGIEQAVRCLAPPLIVLDELGGAEEIEAVTKGLYRGVSAIATVHCREVSELLCMEPLKQALENGVFEYVIMLSGRERPGHIHMCVKAKEWLCARDGYIADNGGRCDERYDWEDAVATARSGVNGGETIAWRDT